MFTLVGFLAVFFQVGGDEDQPEVGEEGLVGPVWRVAALRWCFMRLKTRSTMFRPPRETPTDREPSFSAPRPRAGGPVESAAAWLRALFSNRGFPMSGDRKPHTGHGPCPYPKPKPKCAKNRTLGAADIFLEIITQPFLGFDGIVPGSSNQATV